MATKCWATLLLLVSVFSGISLQLSSDGNENLGSQSFNTDQIVNNVFPYGFPNENVSANLFPMSPCNGLILEEASIDMLQEYMSQGKLTSVQIVTCYMQRAFQVDQYVK